MCTAERPPYGKPSCGAQASQTILAALENELEGRPELADEVAVAGCTCLGPCFEGPAIVVYPEGTWYVGVTTSDVPELVASHMVEGRPLERLMRRPPEAGS